MKTMNKRKSNNNSASSFTNKKKLLNLIPMKSIQDLFINYSVVNIDENGLNDRLNIKKKSINKIFFNLSPENNISSNSKFVPSDNNNNKLENKIDKNLNNDNNIEIVNVSNKVEPKVKKPISLFSIEYNKIINNYILTSLTDEVFFALEIWSNKNFYLEHFKRYYIQLSDIIISILANNFEKNVTVKILNLEDEHSEEKNKYKYNFNLSEFPITIGRNGCSININKNSISKVHLLINYDINTCQFFIRDNFSTNGSLILIKKGKDIKLEDKMFFFLEKEHFILKR